MIKRLILSSKHRDGLKRFAIDSLPLESCALLAGSIDGDDVIVSRIIFTKNYDRSRTTFSIEPTELLESYKEAENHGFDIVGVFHSHPAPAKPSATDTKYMEINPVPWLIMSTTDNELEAFLYDNTINKLDLVVT
ncbi:MAG: M67 family metallopeptidase [Thaumarchaeota archaeon]|nr:M67 family metallopeptidase [Nitrososphaerota archaeon]